MNRTRKNISRKNLRKIIINENISLYQSKIDNEAMKFKARVKMLKKIRHARINENKMAINEFGISDMMPDAGGMLSKFLGAGGDTLKSFLIGKVIGIFGVKEGSESYDMITNALEQIEVTEITGLFSGETTVEEIAESLVKGLVEYIVEKGIGEVFEKVKDIPVLNSVIPNKESLVGKINTEALSTEIANVVTPQIMPMLQDIMSKVSGGMLGGDQESSADAGDMQDATSAIFSEIYSVAAKQSRLKLLSYNKKLRILKIAQKEI